MKTLNKIKLFSLILFGSLSFISCSDFFIQELEIPRQNLDNQLVVHGLFSSLDSSVVIKVARNFNLDDEFTENESLVHDARIEIFENNNSLGELTEIEINNSYCYTLDLSETLGGEGNNYRIEVTHPDYETAVAQSSMPTLVKPEKAIFTRDLGYNNSDEEIFDGVDITLNDPADQENYYCVRVYNVEIERTEIIIPGDTLITTKRYPENYFIQDPIAERTNSGLVFSDKTFNGQRYSMNLVMSSLIVDEDLDIDKIKIEWSSITRDEYEYATSLAQYQTSQQFGLFADPISIFSNIENGLGIMAFRSSYILELEVE